MANGLVLFNQRLVVLHASIADAVAKAAPRPIAFGSNKQVLEVVSCRALPYSGGVVDVKSSIDLTSQIRAGALTWKPPAGVWTVCVFERIVPDTWKRHNIPRRNVNIMDRKTVARFIELTHQRYAKELGPQLDDVVLFFTDEPQLGAVEPWMKMAKTETVPAVQWCDQLPIAFQRTKGYPITDALPALFHNVGPATAPYRHDFYDVYSDLTNATSNVTLT